MQLVGSSPPCSTYRATLCVSHKIKGELSCINGSKWKESLDGPPIQVFRVLEIQHIDRPNMANDLNTWAAESPRRHTRNKFQISQLELELDYSNDDTSIPSSHSERTEIYRGLSDGSESDQDDFWGNDIQETLSTEDVGGPNSASTTTSSTLKGASFDPVKKNVILEVQKFEAIVRRAVRQQVKRNAGATTLKHLDEVISKIRNNLAHNLGILFLDTKPTDPEICYYVLRESAGHEGLNALCQQYFAQLAIGGTVTSNGQTEATFNVIGKDGSRWEVYAPHSSFLALHEKLHEDIQDIENILPDFPDSRDGLFAFVEQKEAYLNKVLALPFDILLGMKEIWAISKPIEHSPIGFDEVYDESLCYRLAERCH